ncbi:MAG TPA: CDP-alcohol phosphatidyltransferase family protein [Polyangiaceae bacterium]|nr:CDP-alcohol phosphatidyltransferase family protein [Polyangiaceae bacterium]
MLSEAKAIYLATRKRNDQLFNTYVMRPIAAVVVALAAKTTVTPNQLTLVSIAIFAVAAAILVAMPGAEGAWTGVAVIELSYLFDCCDGMLARHQKIASQQGHLFDFFTDELKAVMLVCAVGIRLWRTGGYGIDGTGWRPGDAWFLVATVVAVAVVASAISLTNFVRRPEISGQQTPVAAHYEAVGGAAPTRGLLRRAVAHVFTFLRFLNHYPSHIWFFVVLGRLDVFFWMYACLNALYLAKGWLGLVVRFGRPSS